MIVTKRFVFIHMHKTGGQTLGDIIERCICDHKVIGYHYPSSEVPPEHLDLPLVGMVRNPWDWYVSWYAFNARPNIQNPLYSVVSEGGSSNFKSTVKALINLGSDHATSRKHRDELIHLLPETLDKNVSVGLTKDCIRSFSDDESGYYSWLFNRMLGIASDDRAIVGKFEILQSNFLNIMRQLSVDETESIEQELDKHERKNSSQHSHYSHYYDDELRDLVARKEYRLIERFDYVFDSIGPTDNTPTFPADLSTGNTQEFRKLLGRASNYLPLHQKFDVHAIVNKIAQVPEAKWLESERERRFDVHRDTQALLLIHFEDNRYAEPEIRELYYAFQDELKPLVDYIAKFYQDNGFVVRILFAKLLAGGKIREHTDWGHSLLNCHRIHIPIVTNDKARIFVGGEEKNMQVGEFYEINNGLVHAVENKGDEDRIHLIIDWMPNRDGRAKEEILVADPAVCWDDHKGDDQELSAMIAKANQLHQGGKLRQAEAIYRQLLERDENNVVGNNLMGLLCIHTNRFDQALNFLERALAVSPRDVQSHANLGFALKKLKRFDDAATHLEQALTLQPNNPETHNDLGNVYQELGRYGDAIASYGQALAILPQYAEAHHNLGTALMADGRFAEAVASLRQSLSLKPDLPKAKGNLERALIGVGKISGEVRP